MRSNHPGHILENLGLRWAEQMCPSFWGHPVRHVPLTPEVQLMVLDDIAARIPGGKVRATVGGASSFHGLPEVTV